jgi:hypothetical protein
MIARIHAIHVSLPDFSGKATRRKYLCYVSFGSYLEDLPFLKEWLKSYSGLDVKEGDKGASELLCNQNYARAVVWSYVPVTYPGLEITFDKFVPAECQPQGKPTLETDKHKLWMSLLSEEEIETAKSVARALFDECRRRGGRIAVPDARAVFYEKSRGGGFLWEDVIEEFHGLGGAHTDKYLRRQR